MDMTLWNKYLNANFEATRVPWKIYDSHTRRKLSDDYGSMKTDELDNLPVVRIIESYTKAGSKFYRVSVNTI